MSNFRRYYQNNNIVFITIVTYNRIPILIDNIELLRKSLKSINYDFKLLAGIVLPDHLHLLIQAENQNDFPKIISSFKANFSRLMPMNKYQSSEQIKRREKGIWQRKYYDHIIRNEEDLFKHLDYIHYNSFKHLNIQPKDYKYSSFEKFVQKGFYEENWCNFGNKHNIDTMNLE